MFKEKFYEWLNKFHPKTSLKPVQKILLYTYFQIQEQKDRTQILDLIDEYEEQQECR